MSSTYCVEADVQKRFGTTNLDTYLNIDGANTSGEKTARLNAAIEAVSEGIDDVMRTCQNSHAIPLLNSAGSTPPTIKDLAAWLTGIWVYEGNGVLDTDKDNNPIHKYAFRLAWCERVLEEIRTGKRKIDAVS